MPQPFINEQFTFTQPDGTEFEVVGTGNQFDAVFETPDGLHRGQGPRHRNLPLRRALR